MAADFFKIFKNIYEYVKNPVGEIPQSELAVGYVLKCFAVTNPGLLKFFREELHYNCDYDITYNVMSFTNMVRGIREYYEKYGRICPAEIMKGNAQSSLPDLTVFRSQIRQSLGEQECVILANALKGMKASDYIYEMYYEQSAAEAMKAAKLTKKEADEIGKRTGSSSRLDILFVHHNDFRARAKKTFDTFMSYYGLKEYTYEVMNGDNNNDVTECILKRDPKVIVLLGANACEDMGIDKDGIVNRCGNSEAHNGREYIIAMSLSYVAENSDQDVYNNMSNAFRRVMEMLAPDTVEDDINVKSKKAGTLLADGKIYSYKGLPDKFYNPEWILIDVAEHDRFNIEHVFRNAKTGKKLIQKTANSEYDYYYILKDVHAVSKPFVKATETLCKRGPYQRVPEDKAAIEASRNTIVYNTSIRYPTRAVTDYYYNTKDEVEYLPKVFRYDIETDITTNFHGIDMTAPYKVTYISAEYMGEYYMWILDSDKCQFRESTYMAFDDGLDDKKTKRVKTYKQERKLHIFEFAGNESYMLQHFWYTLTNECDPDIMVGWNSSGFDFPYMYTRSIKLPYYRSDEHKCTMSSDALTVLDIFGYMNKSIVCPMGDEKFKTPYITGIIIADMQKLYEAQHQNKLESYALNYISDLELNLGKKAFPPAGASTDEWIAYNLWDTELLELLDFNVQITNFRFFLMKITKGPWIDSEDKKGVVSSLLFDEAKHTGIVLRTSKLAEIATEKHIKQFVGGFTQTNAGGLYEMLVDYDGKSMYPSLMMTFNIGPNTFRYTIPPADAIKIMTGCFDPEKVVRMYTAELYYKDGYELPYQDVTLRYVHDMVKKNNYIITPSGAIFCSMQEEKSILYDLLLYLTTERDKTKKTMKENGVLNMAKYNKQLALKVSANAFFGVFGFKPFFYYNKTLATAITTTGRMLIKCIMHAIENRYQKNGKTLLECARTIDVFKTQDLFFKYTIYADTDGCVIQFGSMLEGKNMTLDEKLAWTENELKSLNEYIKTVVNEIYTYFNKGEGARYMYFKEDWFANKGLFYPYKHKFYAIRLIKEEGKPTNEILYRGIAIRKSTYPALTKERLSELMEIVLDRNDMDFGKFFKRSAEIEQEFINCCVTNDMRVGTPVRVSKNFEDFKVVTQSADAMWLWNDLQGRDEFKILSRGYLFIISNINFMEIGLTPERVKEIQAKHRMNSVCVPLDCQELPKYITIDKKNTMEKVWYTPYQNVFSPLIERSDTSSRPVIGWL